MGPRTKERWIQALRSSDYRQGTGHLYNGQTYCCLGVLCDVLGYKKVASAAWPFVTPKKEKVVNSVGGLSPEGDVDDGIAGLPYSVRSVLAEWNDNGVSFEELAEWLDKHLMTVLDLPNFERRAYMEELAPDSFVMP